jgi:hypothetical protein
MLAQYAARMNIQLLKAADLNQMLHERGIDKNITVQKICTRARNESEAREVLGKIWTEPAKAEELLVQLLDRNKDVYKFEQMLSSNQPQPVTQVVNDGVRKLPQTITNNNL